MFPATPEQRKYADYIGNITLPLLSETCGGDTSLYAVTYAVVKQTIVNTL